MTLRLLRLLGGAAAILALVALPVSAAPAPVPAHVLAQELAPSLDVTLEDVQPQVLQADRDLTIRGNVRNAGAEAWTDVRAQVVMARNPFTLHHELDTAYGDDPGPAAAALRRPLPDQVLDLGTIDAQDVRSFSVTVEHDDLGILGAEGVYPVGIVLTGIDPSGEVVEDAGSASSFVPLVEDDPEPVPTGVLVPFVSAVVDPLGDPSGLLEDLGRLDRLATAAGSVPSAARTLAVDVALLDGLDAAGDTEPLALEVRDAIVDLARTSDTNLIRYAEPDESALVADESFLGATRRATREVADRFGLASPTIARLSAGTLTADVLARTTADLLAVPRADLTGWTRSDGQVLRAGGVGVVVSQSLPGPGRSGTAAVVRQRLLADAALTNFTRRLDPASRGTVLTILPALWDPGLAPSRLGAAFSADLVEPASVAAQRADAEPLASTLPRTAASTGLEPARVLAASALQDAGAELARIVSDPATVTRDVDRHVATALSLRWADEDGLSFTRDIADELRTNVDAVTLTSPRTATLSGRTGSFPVTISNDSAYEVEVGVLFEATNRSVTVAEGETLTIGPDGRRTVTVEVDMDDQQSTIVTARLRTADGSAFGQPTDLNVRASNVGTVIWITMGVTAVVFALTMVRRFRKRGDAS